jgi:phosphomevalonate kinase
MIEPIIFTISSEYPQCGKSTLAEQFVKAIQSSFNLYIAKHYEPIILNFADKLKKEVAECYHLDYNKLLTDNEYKALHRPKLIEHGNRMREVTPEYWINGLMDSYKEMKFKRQPIIFIPDRRYFNEDFRQYKIKKLVTICVYTELDILRKRINNDEVFISNVLLAKNESQREMKISAYNFDYIVSNNKSIEFLNNEAKCILMEELKHEK